MGIMEKMETTIVVTLHYAWVQRELHAQCFSLMLSIGNYSIPKYKYSDSF